MGLLKLAERHSEERLELACKKALSFTATPSYKIIKNIFATGSANPLIEPEKHGSTHNSYGITRGADYYGR
jgi:hypothetical protein